MAKAKLRPFASAKYSVQTEFRTREHALRFVHALLEDVFTTYTPGVKPLKAVANELRRLLTFDQVMDQITDLDLHEVLDFYFTQQGTFSDAKASDMLEFVIHKGDSTLLTDTMPLIVRNTLGEFLFVKKAKVLIPLTVGIDAKKIEAERVRHQKELDKAVAVLSSNGYTVTKKH